MFGQLAETVFSKSSLQYWNNSCFDLTCLLRYRDRLASVLELFVKIFLLKKEEIKEIFMLI